MQSSLFLDAVMDFRMLGSDSYPERVVTYASLKLNARGFQRVQFDSLCGQIFALKPFNLCTLSGAFHFQF